MKWTAQYAGRDSISVLKSVEQQFDYIMSIMCLPLYPEAKATGKWSCITSTAWPFGSSGHSTLADKTGNGCHELPCRKRFWLGCQGSCSFNASSRIRISTGARSLAKLTHYSSFIYCLVIMIDCFNKWGWHDALFVLVCFKKRGPGILIMSRIGWIVCSRHLINAQPSSLTTADWMWSSVFFHSLENYWNKALK